MATNASDSCFQRNNFHRNVTRILYSFGGRRGGVRVRVRVMLGLSEKSGNANGDAKARKRGVPLASLLCHSLPRSLAAGLARLSK